MSLADYYTIDAAGLRISANQASDFAKTVAGDFNPLHDPDNRRFCVPGDLLFTAVLQHYGVSQRMQFRFAGMVGPDLVLQLQEASCDACELRDIAGKTYLHVRRDGEVTRDSQLIERLARDYVAFSGHNFPHILVPLMRDQGVMINVDRPMVVYESMAFELERLDIPALELRLADSKLNVEGKRGEVLLTFEFLDGKEVFGTGCKRLLLSGLRPYDQDSMDGLVTSYLASRDNYRPPGTD
ncbi:MAG: DUF3581 domain-containing protein [Gammaproteobacteria bacterium]|nr:DUF3581 domain-containing protein [Gammaproteobacteria bacterium]